MDQDRLRAAAEAGDVTAMLTLAEALFPEDEEDTEGRAVTERW
jgi:hypothetical protein